MMIEQVREMRNEQALGWSKRGKEEVLVAGKSRRKREESRKEGASGGMSRSM